ncbi:cation transporter [Virgibacillus halodenitrificans]|uniref:Copper chaperone CopZ n=1 Tax=Virgibacillus halodenitrificans TaxID=1482 RepID=A0ABR7VQQ8_VIRHA|nr:heavy metal-associated domain-containing protein [Virgibacillus halodenitrificans]MBD1224096.1 heavy-metal-associated domain-containing protein [Virgibacillus halodenitrificans]
MNETVYLDIKGMHCVNCPIKVEKSVSKMNGIIEIDVNWKSEQGCVTYDRNLVSISEITERIGRMGFTAQEVNTIKR